jgi:protein pelota
VVAELACDPTQHADLGAIIMQEGLAHVCLVTTSMTLVRAKIENNIPRKRKGQCSQHDKVFTVKIYLTVGLSCFSHQFL